MADQKITQLTELTTPATEDLLAIVDDPSGTPIAKKVTIANLLTAMKLDDLAAPDDNTDLNASTSAHGLLPKLNNVATDFLNGQGGWSAPAGGSAFYDAYVCIRDKKAQNTDGGTFTSGAWRTRDLNDEHADTANIASVASNQITLAAGTYRCLITAPALKLDLHQLRLQNITDAVTLLTGSNAHMTSGTTITTHAFLCGRFTLAAQKTLEIQHRCSTTKLTNGFGASCNFTDEIYTVAELWREA